MGYVWLIGPDRNVWEKPDVEDLIALKDHDSERVLGNKAVRWWHHTLGRYFRVCDEPVEWAYVGAHNLGRNQTNLVRMGMLSSIPTALLCALVPVLRLSALRFCQSWPSLYYIRL